MKNLPLSDQVFVFVCYKAGTGGEYLSTCISKIESCVHLEYYTTDQNRTIITSDFFEKVFLYSVGPFENLLQKAKIILAHNPLIQNKLHVSPSHWDYDFLIPYFPKSKFIRIFCDDTELIKKNVEEKINNGKFSTFLEFKGFCLIYVEQIVFETLFQQRQIAFNKPIGETYNVLQNHLKSSENSVFRSKLKIDHKQVFNLEYDTYNQHQREIVNFILDR